ncbi:hypothetical protein PQX77_002636, partial [Marasmius sp. AFHP31]
MLPDRFLHTLLPIIMIRHPVRVLPSYLRAFDCMGSKSPLKIDENYHYEESVSTFKGERLLFDAFKAHGSSIVIDGDKS